MDKRPLLKFLALIPLSFLILLVIGALFGMLRYLYLDFDNINFYFPPHFFYIIWFSIKQAALCAFFSVLVAIPVAWSCYKNRHAYLVKLFERIFSFPIIISSLVAINSIILLILLASGPPRKHFTQPLVEIHSAQSYCPPPPVRLKFLTRFPDVITATAHTSRANASTSCINCSR